MRTLFLASILTLAGLAQAQNCGTLTITGSGAAGTQVGVALTAAAANAFAVVFVGENAGATTLPLPMGASLSLGLAEPFFPVPLGRTDGNGDASLQVTVPSFISQQYALHAQAAAIGITWMPFGITGCTSNVVPLTIG